MKIRIKTKALSGLESLVQYNVARALEKTELTYESPEGNVRAEEVRYRDGQLVELNKHADLAKAPKILQQLFDIYSNGTPINIPRGFYEAPNIHIIKKEMTPLAPVLDYGVPQTLQKTTATYSGTKGRFTIVVVADRSKNKYYELFIESTITEKPSELFGDEFNRAVAEASKKSLAPPFQKR